MTVNLRDPVTLRGVAPLNLARYLRAGGWRERSNGSQASTWTLAATGGEYELLAPLDASLRDYALRVGDALAVLEASEGRPRLDIWEDLTRSGFDAVRVRTCAADGDEGTIPLAEGVQLLKSTEEMLLAAACATLEPKRAYPTRKPQRALDYLASVRWAAPAAGSFVVTALSPVPPNLQPTESGQEHPDVAEPYERDVSITLGRALEALTGAAQKASEEAFEAAIRSGVSANLCSAVGGMLPEAETTGRVEISVSWATVRPASRSLPNRAVLPATLLPVVREAGRIFRDKTPVDDFEIRGSVVRLDRSEGEDFGRATVLGVVDGELRKVVVTLREPEYRTAITAHRERAAVRCAGVLRRTATSFFLEAAHGFELADVG